MVGGAVSASHQAISYTNDLSASAQAQLNTLREGSATANNAINAQFANSASKASVIGTIAAANVPDLTARNVFTGTLVSDVAAVKISSARPGFILDETDGGSDQRFYRFNATSGTLVFDLLNDAGSSATQWLRVTRSGTTASAVSIDATTVIVNGYSVLSPPALNGVAAAAYARLDTAQTFAKGNGSTIVQLGTTGTITPNCEDGNVFRVGPLTGNVTLAAPSNPRSGQTIVIHVIQGAGGHTGSWNSIYRFAGSTDPTLSTAASARDVFAFNYDSVSDAWCQAGLNVG